MTDYNTKRSLGSYSSNYDLFVAATYMELEDVLLDAATAGYVPAIGDVLCRKSDDTDKHQKYDRTDAALVILGVIEELVPDNTGTPVVKMSFAVTASVHYAALGVTGTMNAAQKLVLKDLLKLKNITLVD